MTIAKQLHKFKIILSQVTDKNEQEAVSGSDFFTILSLT